MAIQREPRTTYPIRDAEYLARREGITPRMVAEYIYNNPYFGRDQALAEGWLIMIGAIETGEDPLAKLAEFVTLVFLQDNNNGVPLTQEGYPQVETADL